MILTEDNYFSKEADSEFCSVSQWKAFRKCPACAMAILRGEWQKEETPALLVGSYVDSWFDGTLDKFREEHPAIFTKSGELKADYKKAEEVIARVQRDPLFMEYMSGDKQVIMTGIINGVKCKIKVDSLDIEHGRFTDLKVMKDFQPIYDEDEMGRVPFWTAWKYDVQLGVYAEIIRQCTGKKLQAYIAAATKEKTVDYAVFHMSEAELENGLKQFADTIMTFDAMKKGIVDADSCGECSYCRETKVLHEVIETDSILL